MAVGYVLSILKAAGRFTRRTDVPLISRKDADTFIVACMFTPTMAVASISICKVASECVRVPSPSLSHYMDHRGIGMIKHGLLSRFR